VGVKKGRFLLALGYIRHVLDRQKPFADDFGFYVFTRRARVQCNHVKRARARLAQLTVEDILVNMMDASSGVSVRDRKWHLKTYRQAFVGADATTWLTEFLFCDRDTGVQRGQEMADAGYIRDVGDANKPFLDDGHLYVFTEEAQLQLSQSRRRLDAGLELDSLTAVVQAMMHPLSGVPCKDRKRALRTFKDSFTGEAATDWMIQQLRIRSREDATAFGQTLMSEGYVDSDHANSFLDHSSKYYRWAYTTASLPRPSTATDASTSSSSFSFSPSSSSSSSPSSSPARHESAAGSSPSSGSISASASFSSSLASDSSTALPLLSTSPVDSPTTFVSSSAAQLPRASPPGPTATAGLSSVGTSSPNEPHQLQRFDQLNLHANGGAAEANGGPAAHLSFSSGSLPVLSPRTTKVSAGDFEQLRVLGVGGFGRVFQVRQKGTGKVYAMKVIPKSKLKSERDLRNLLSERNILRNTHTFLLHMHWAWQSADKLYMVMDYLGGGDLFFHLQQHRGGFARKTVQFFVAEVLLALEYLHSCGVLYRDMKLENVLLDHYGHVCLADFGLSSRCRCFVLLLVRSMRTCIVCVVCVCVCVCVCSALSVCA
jgi:Protein kinase domain/Domain found in Dishevelled, Egl-10, and Pleckstrin (DEP)